MQIIRLFILMLFINISLEANYCIQVLTTNKSELNFVVNEAKSTKYNSFDSVRVESRGNYLVFRIGDYFRYGDARDDIADIRRIKKGAYIRKCDFSREKSLYVKNEIKQKEITNEIVYQEPILKKRKVVRKIPKKRYAKKEELTYSYKDSSSSLWGDCKKCFIPVYEEEEENTRYEEDARAVKKRVEQKREIRMEIEDPIPTKESFWAKDTHSQVKRENRIRNKKRNKFNIDEQFLP